MDPKRIGYQKQKLIFVLEVCYAALRDLSYVKKSYAKQEFESSTKKVVFMILMIEEFVGNFFSECWFWINVICWEEDIVDVGWTCEFVN